MAKLALSMIVRDAAATLPACLESVRGVADEIVIADTGSVDATPEIARQYGARTLRIPWENDFAKARNRALAAVQAEWALVLDADEVLDPSAARLIPPLLVRGGIAGYQVTIRNYFTTLDNHIWDRPAKPNDSTLPAAKGFAAYVEHENVRLFQRDERIFFVGRVHESVGSRVEAAGLRLGSAPFLIHHFGLAATPDKIEQKNRFYRELGRLKAAEMPREAQAHLELGLVELDNFGNTAEALACFERACQLKPRLGVAWFFAGNAHLRLGHHREALRCFQRAEKNGQATATLAEGMGDAQYNVGDFAEALRAYERALRLSPGSVITESKLGLTMMRAGKMDEGLERIRQAVAQKPAAAELQDRLILALVLSGRATEAAQAAEDKLRRLERPAMADFRRAASLWAKQANWKRAMAVLQIGIQLYPSEAPLQNALAEVRTKAGSQAHDFTDVFNSNVLEQGTKAP